MTLRGVLDRVQVTAVRGNPDVEIAGLAYDSRRVRTGDAFFALGGLHRDGRAFVGQAFASGAAAAVVARTASEGSLAAPAGAAVVEVEHPRRALAQASVNFHRNPASALRVVGVTGTNGKTTTTWLVDAIFRAAGIRSGVLGTTGYRVGDELRPAPFTTPEAPELHGLLREMTERGLAGVALELSSHALAQCRCFGLDVDVAVFTNLSHDHLDYHGTLERYLDAKLMLFDGRNAPNAEKRATAVINADDAALERVRSAAHRGGMVVSAYGTAPDSAIRIESIEPHATGLRFALVEGALRSVVELPLLGPYNAWNAAAAYGAARALGVDVRAAVRGLASAPGVPGRLERVDAGQPFAVVVDYAHTPDALDRAIAAVREHLHGRVLLVFGCGGDRDRAKRPVMGRVAATSSDAGWITNDNPRGEDPARIASEVRAGDPAGRLRVELDRRAAIAAALAEARRGDVVLVAGKGHETTQTIGDRVMPFDDREIARELLRGVRGAS